MTHEQLRIYFHSDLRRSYSQHSSLLSHQDFSEYASYCTRRLHRLRHAAPVKKDLLHIRLYKSSPGTREEKTALEAGKSTAMAASGGGRSTGPGSKAKYAYRAIELGQLPTEILKTHVNYFYEPLYCAERCWASAMAIKTQSHATSGSKENNRHLLSPGKIRARSIKRLIKAAKYATILETLTTSTRNQSSVIDALADTKEEIGQKKNSESLPPVDEHTHLEARAYAAWMRGNVALEQNRWQTACIEYQAALSACETLANGGAMSQGIDTDGMRHLEIHDLFTTRAKNVILPLLRFCYFELQETGTSSTEEVLLYNPTTPFMSDHLRDDSLELQGNNSSSLSQIVFRDNVIVVETRELKMTLIKVQDLFTEWQNELKMSSGKSSNNNNTGSSSADAKFMALLSGYDDIISLVNQELKQLVTLKIGPAVKAKKYQLVNLLGYAKHQKLKLVMERNESMVIDIVKRHDGFNRKKNKEMTLKYVEEVTHLYDALLQDARAISAIPGGGSIDDFDFETIMSSVEDEFLLEAKANILRLRALRCYYLAKMYASPLVNKYSQALALFDQAESLAREALEEIGACDQMEKRDMIMEQLTHVFEEMKADRCRAIASAYLTKTSLLTSSLPLLQRLYDYDIPASPTSIIDFPLKLEPLACKPSFFDVALNYVSEYPIAELEDALIEHVNKSASTGSSGILGWFRRG